MNKHIADSHDLGVDFQLDLLQMKKLGVNLGDVRRLFHGVSEVVPEASYFVKESA